MESIFFQIIFQIKKEQVILYEKEQYLTLYMFQYIISIIEIFGRSK